MEFWCNTFWSENVCTHLMWGQIIKNWVAIDSSPVWSFDPSQRRPAKHCKSCDTGQRKAWWVFVGLGWSCAMHYVRWLFKVWYGRGHQVSQSYVSMNEGINQASNNQGGSRVAGTAKIFWDQFVYPKLYPSAARYGRNWKKIRVVSNLMLANLRAH